jgi:hypothetical protein
VDPHPVEHRTEGQRGISAYRPEGQPVLVQIRPGDQPLAERGPSRVRHRKITEKLVHHVVIKVAFVFGGHQDRKKRGADHAHACQPSR